MHGYPLWIIDINGHRWRVTRTLSPENRPYWTHCRWRVRLERGNWETDPVILEQL